MAKVSNKTASIRVLTGIWLLALAVVQCGPRESGLPDDKPFTLAGILLTWQHDPTTTMTIDWHLYPEDGHRKSLLQFRERGTEEWHEVTALRKQIPYFDRIINRVELRNLKPDTKYDFRLSAAPQVYYFQTMPDRLDRPVIFAAGGDIHFRKEGDIAGPLDFHPDFVINPGEGPNVNGDPYRVQNWYDWFESLLDNLIHDDGRVIPYIAAIGNHEVFQKSRLLGGQSPHHEHSEREAERFMREHNLWSGKATYFTHFFAFPGRENATYGVLDFGNYLSLIVLDSGINSPMTGGQEGWLASVLEARKERTHLLPVYRYSAYPASRPYEGAARQAVRDIFLPLFEGAGVNVVLESQDHNTYKRTHPLRNNQRDESGIVYIGSGIWDGAGRPARSGHNPWYIETFHGNSHGIVGKIFEDRIEFQAIGISGEVFDRFMIEARN